ncbi:MAG: PAS domain-containing protein [Rhodospirillaceae bacterium]|nr:PAS domain-containing protein [Rhodospirillaceae bacterium]
MEFVSKAVELEPANLGEAHTSIYRYWNEMRGGRVFPSWPEVDMMALPLAIVPWCSVVDVVEGGKDFIIRFWGTERVRLLGVDYTGHRVSEFRSPDVSAKIQDELSQVISEQRPLLVETMLSLSDMRGLELTTFQVLRLPFGEKTDVNTILNAPQYPNDTQMLYEWFGAEVPLSVLSRRQAARTV